MGETDKKEGARLSADRISLAISILALLVSGFTLYYQFLLGPVVRAYRPNGVYLTKTQIGIPVAFTNTGTAAEVVTDGWLKLNSNDQGPDQSLKLRWVSPFEKRFSYENGQWKEEVRTYSPFSHLLLKAGDTDEEVFWFEPPGPSNFSLQAGHYRACAAFRAVNEDLVRPGAKAGRPLAAKEGCSTSMEFDLNSGQVGVLSSNRQESLYIDTN